MNRARVLEILDAEATFERFEQLAQALAARGIYVLGGLTAAPDDDQNLGLRTRAKEKAPPWFGEPPSR